MSSSQRNEIRRTVRLGALLTRILPRFCYRVQIKARANVAVSRGSEERRVSGGRLRPRGRRTQTVVLLNDYGLGSVGRRGARLPVAFTEVRGTGFACTSFE